MANTLKRDVWVRCVIGVVTVKCPQCKEEVKWLSAINGICKECIIKNKGDDKNGNIR